MTCTEGGANSGKNRLKTLCHRHRRLPSLLGSSGKPGKGNDQPASRFEEVPPVRLAWAAFAAKAAKRRPGSGRTTGKPSTHQALAFTSGRSNCPGEISTLRR